MLCQHQLWFWPLAFYTTDDGGDDDDNNVVQNVFPPNVIGIQKRGQIMRMLR